jgi:Glucose / Sorbosone dehydrogenase
VSVRHPARRHRAARVRALPIVVLLVGLVLADAACGSDDRAESSAPEVLTVLLVPDAAWPVALVAEPDGSLLYGERLTGAVRRVDAGGRLAPQPVTTIAVRGAESDQRGLLGLARDAEGRLFAAWTRADDGRIVVGEVDVEPHRIVWAGPVSANLANGGHLAVLGDGRLLIGIGDLLQPGQLAEDPSVPNRKLLVLDPEGPAVQAPTILSAGWNNPFAFTVGLDGVVWVADNTGGGGPERIGRGDRPASEATAMGGPGEGEVVPAALVSLGADRLGLCSFLEPALREVRIEAGRPVVTGQVVASPCATGATRLADGRVVLATPDRIVVTATGL